MDNSSGEIEIHGYPDSISSDTSEASKASNSIELILGSPKPLERRKSDPVDLLKVRDLFEEALQEHLEEICAEKSSPQNFQGEKPPYSLNKPPLPRLTKSGRLACDCTPVPAVTESEERQRKSRERRRSRSGSGLLGYLLTGHANGARSGLFVPSLKTWSSEFRRKKLEKQNQSFHNSLIGDKSLKDRFKKFRKKSKKPGVSVHHYSIEKVIKRVNAHEAALRQAELKEKSTQHSRGKNKVGNSSEEMSKKLTMTSNTKRPSKVPNPSKLEDKAGKEDKPSVQKVESDATPPPKQPPKATKRLLRENYYRVKHNKMFSEWKILIGPDDWKNYENRKANSERYRTQNLPSYLGPGVYELGVTRDTSARKYKPRQIAVMYVGQAENIRQRLQQYGQNGSHLELGKKAKQEIEQVAPTLKHNKGAPNGSSETSGQRKCCTNTKTQKMACPPEDRLPELHLPKDEALCFNCAFVSSATSDSKPSAAQSLDERDLESSSPAFPEPGLFSEAFSRKFAIMFRWVKVASKARALEAETQLLATFDYAWNQQQNGNRRPERALSKACDTPFGPSCFCFGLFAPRAVGVRLELNRASANSHSNQSDTKGKVHGKSSWSFEMLKEGIGAELCGAYKHTEAFDIQEAKQVAMNDPTMGGLLCGADMGNGETCPRKPLPRRKRCALHKGVRVTSTPAHRSF